MMARSARQSSDFYIALAWGKWAENVVAEALKRQGWYIIRQHDIVTQYRGPRAEAADTDLILTDLMRMKNGVSRLAEIKLKDGPALLEYRNELRHGIDLPYWLQYLELQSQSGIPGDLIILELTDQARFRR